LIVLPEFGRMVYFNPERNIGFADHHMYAEHVLIALENGCGLQVQINHAEDLIKFTSSPVHRLPQSGDWIVMDIRIGPDGPYAERWALTEQYHRQLVKFISMELDRRERLQRHSELYRVKSLRHGWQLPATIWIGSGAELEKELAEHAFVIQDDCWIERKINGKWHKHQI